jgi:hypothetical protein
VSSEDAPSKVDTSVAHPARRYDYWLGGKDNFAADRASGDAIEAMMPTVRLAVRENRDFLRRAVRYAAEQEHIRQYLDIGTGIPTAPNTHQIAQQADPTARIVYVDNDPLVLVHARALLTGSPQGRTAYIEADLRRPQEILANEELAETLDMTQPVALLLLAVLHFVRNEENPRAIIDTLLDALPNGSLVVASHVTLEHLPPAEAEELIRTDGQARPRSGLDLTALFGRPDLQLIAPVQSVSAWFDTRSDGDRPAAEDVACNGLVARVVRGPITSD